MGDEDHIGGAFELINNFKVDKIILNRGEYTDLEKELISISTDVDIVNNIKKLKVNNKYLHFLNDKIYTNENDNSIILYFEHLKHKFLFMGDATFVSEDYLLENYNISNISILKVGHHGSSTSSSRSFIKTINPKVSLISVKKNNYYGHPTKEVLTNLNKSKIYRTDNHGSIKSKIFKNKIKIVTYIN